MTKTIVVAGGSAPLGNIVASELLTRQYSVIIVDRSTSFVDGAALYSGIDLANEQLVREAYRRIARDHGPISGLVNVVGNFTLKTLFSGVPEIQKRLYQLSLTIVETSCRMMIQHLDHHASIVNLGAKTIHVPEADVPPRSVQTITEALAAEFQPTGVRVNGVLPTILDTPENRRSMPNADRSTWTTPENAAKAVAHLLSDKSTINGACVPFVSYEQP